MRKIFFPFLIVFFAVAMPVAGQVTGSVDGVRDRVAAANATLDRIKTFMPPGTIGLKRGTKSASWEKAKEEAFRKNVLATQAEQKVRVDKVIDGDTFEIVTNGLRLTLRLAGIDAPEEGQENWKEAKDRLSEMIRGKEVLVKFSTFYPRHVNGFFIVRAFIDKSDAGSLMLNNGWAWYDKTYGVFFEKKEHEENIEAMKNAKSAKLGIWKSGKAKEPWDYFEKAQKEKTKASKN